MEKNDNREEIWFEFSAYHMVKESVFFRLLRSCFFVRVHHRNKNTRARQKGILTFETFRFI